MDEQTFRVGDLVRIRRHDTWPTKTVYEVTYVGKRWVGTNKHGSSKKRKTLVTVRPANPDGDFVHRDFVPSELEHVSVVDRLATVGKFLPTEEDIGRGVLYTPYPGAKTEDGIITSLNDEYVFVRYAGDVHSKATRYEDLRWLSA
jgi:hypothetical protein